MIAVSAFLLSCNAEPERAAQANDTIASQKNNQPAPPDAANSRSAIYYSTDFGITWSALHTGIPADARVVLMEPRGAQMLVATDHHGLFLSDEKRQEWKQIGSSLPDVKITVLHLADDEIYAGVYRQGIFVSKNNGENWIALNGDLANLSVRAILKSKGNLLVATDAGIFKSAIGQRNWKQVFSGCQIISLNQSGSKIVASGVLGVLLSADEGEHWNWIHQAGAAHNTTLINDKIIVMNISGDLFTSDDWGKSWHSENYFPREKSYVYETVKVGQYFVLSNNYGIHRSNDEGKTWENIYKTEELVFLDLIVFGNTIYGGTAEWGERRKKSK